MTQALTQKPPGNPPPDAPPGNPAVQPAEDAARAVPAAARGALSIRRGTRVQLGYRKGKVDTVRGGWKKPYDVRITWDGEKYPQYILFTTLEHEWERGTLKVE